MQLALTGRRCGACRHDRRIIHPQTTFRQLGVRLRRPHPAVAQLGHHLGADPAVVLAAHVLLRQQDRHRGCEMLQLYQISRGGSEFVGDQDRGLLVGNVDDQPAHRSRRHVQDAGDGTVSRGDLGDDGLVEFRRQRIRGVEGDVTGARVKHREPTRQIPAQLSQHLGRRRLPNRLPDDVVHPFRHRHPASVARRVGDGATDGRESDGVGHDHHGELQRIGQCRRGGGELRGGGIQPDHQAAHSLVHQPADQCGLTAVPTPATSCRSSSATHHRRAMTRGLPGRTSEPRSPVCRAPRRPREPPAAGAVCRPDRRSGTPSAAFVGVHRLAIRQLHGRHRCSGCGRTA